MKFVHEMVFEEVAIVRVWRFVSATTVGGVA
jgi:hypothetical protein